MNWQGIAATREGTRTQIARGWPETATDLAVLRRLAATNPPRQVNAQSLGVT
jgi:hypothetical protein